MKTNLIDFFVQSFQLDKAEITENLIDGLYQKSFDTNELALRMGQVCSFIGFIEKGAARTFNVIDGVEHTLYFSVENQWITSYWSYLTQQASDIYIECLEPTTLTFIPKSLLDKLYDTIHYSNRVGRLVAEQLYLAEYQRNKDLLTLNAAERYQKLIDTRPEVLQRFKLQYIASYIGIKKESLSRIRKKMHQG